MIPILYEDNHCLVLNKPAGLLSQGDAGGDPSVVDVVAAYLKEAYAKPGNVFVGLVHRLDRPTSGAILVARTSKAATRLSDQFRRGGVTKTYLAVVEGLLRLDDEGEMVDWLVKDESTNTVASVPQGTPGAQHAHLAYRVLDRHLGRATLELTPTTGRGHQIRVQLASRKLPIVGDRKYGSRVRLDAEDGRPRIALHAHQLRFTHPTKGEPRSIEAPLPSDWPARTGPG
ncbi:RluA family pseudouridine synthase [Tundrisphaera sp. TA3]|uniref:RluA family pseudouridine synthase n=1 Tax=Tundrisphaera sp. TA3 TaxID=3435775 RepID=UPI003EBDF6CA